MSKHDNLEGTPQNTTFKVLFTTKKTARNAKTRARKTGSDLILNWGTAPVAEQPSQLNNIHAPKQHITTILLNNTKVV